MSIKALWHTAPENKTKNNHIDKVHCKIPYFSSVTTPSAKLGLSFTMETNYQL